jgi:GABA permease
MTMIALGGVIGAGLFVGSGVVIKSAGPAAVVSFVITGLLVVLVMRMLGEMAAALPTVGSFYEYARYAFSDRPRLAQLAGFLSGWMYWYFWVIVVAMETVAGANLIQFWWPNAPGWGASLVMLVLLTITNLFSVRSYGEFEFWFASIKVAAIAVFLLVGGMYVLGLWPGVHAGIANLTAHGGFAPNGILPVLTGAVAATGFYFGAEIVSVAAAEAAEPAKAVAAATNWVISRTLLFYIGSILVVVCLVPWNSAGIATPYASSLSVIGIPAAAHIMNAVVLTAVLSALNSGLYASSRMLFALTRHGHRGDICLPADCGVAVALTHLTYVTIAGMVCIVIAMGLIPEQRTPLLFGIISVGILMAAYALRARYGKKPDVGALNFKMDDRQ